MIVMIVWNQLVSLGRKLYLFVCHVEQVGSKQWVAKGAAIIQWKGEVGHCKTNIRRGVQRAKKDRSIVFLEFVVVFNLRRASSLWLAQAPVTALYRLWQYNQNQPQQGLHHAPTISCALAHN